jgi:PAS domain S-box-containing protein
MADAPAPGPARTAPLVLVVEDNPLTRGVVLEILRTGGYDVLEAADGRTALAVASEKLPDLVLQDMALPDMDGVELLRWMRAQVGPRIPILALSGLPAEIRRAQDEAKIDPSEGFTDFLTKPIGASALLLAVQAHLAAPPSLEPGPGAGGRRILVAEGGEPLEALGLLLGQAGHAVSVAGGLEEALAEARRNPPEAVVAGGLLPEGDGFRLCRAIRSDPGLEGVPVVLVSAVFTEPEDEALARGAGASALVVPGAGGGAVAREVAAALAGKPLPPSLGEQELEAILLRRSAAALRRESVRRGEVERRLGFHAAALTLLGAMAESLARPREAVRGPDEILARCLAAAGTSQGAAFLRRKDGSLALSSQVGFGEAAAAELREFFGHLDLLDRALEEREPLVLPSPKVSPEASLDVLGRLRARSVLVTPVFLGPDHVGVLVMVSARFDLVDWVDLSRAVSFEIAQALALGRAVTSLSASEARYRGVFEGAAWGIFRTNSTGTLAEANPALAALLGVGSPEELVGTTPSRFCGREEDRARLEEMLEAGGRFTGIDVEWRRGDGAPLRVRLSGRPLRSEEGAPDGFLVFVEDTGARKEMEERLRSADRLSAMQRLAGGIAHELNNLLTAIAGRGELLARSLEGEADLHGHAVEIQRAVHRAGIVARELQAFGRRAPELREVDLNEVVEAALPMVRQIAGEAVSVLVRKGAGLGKVFADPAEIEMALVGLAARAREAMPGGGIVSLETTTAVVDEAAAAAHPGAKAGHHVLLSVADSGPPLDQETRDRVFEPVATGGGPGLATVKDFAQRSGGFVHVVPGKERGNTFRLHLPRTGEGAAPAKGAPAEKAAGATTGPVAGEVVLLAEDEEAVRSLIAETLRLEGYSVVEARDGDEAIRAAGEVEGDIDLLVSDLMMPRLGGRELAERLRRRRPGLAVLFVTGYLDRAPAADGALVLQKPFTPTQLAAKVREALASRPKGDR